MYLKLSILIFVTIAVVWLWTDFAYSRIVLSRWRKFDRALKRNEDGVQVGSEAYSAGTGETAILLVHGLNDSPAIYHKVVPVLVEQGFHCRVMRLPGFAESIQDYAAHNRQDWITAVDEELSQLRRACPRVHVIAHSLGAAVVIACLSRDTTKADRVALLAPGIAVSNRRSKLLSARAWHELGKRTLWFTWFTYSPYDNDAHDESARNPPGRTRFTPLRVIDETFQLMDENQKQFAKFRSPLYLAVALRDNVVDAEASLRFFDAISSTEKELRRVEDAGHPLAIDFGWRERTEEIVDFFRAIEDE